MPCNLHYSVLRDMPGHFPGQTHASARLHLRWACWRTYKGTHDCKPFAKLLVCINIILRTYLRGYEHGQRRQRAKMAIMRLQPPSLCEPASSSPELKRSLDYLLQLQHGYSLCIAALRYFPTIYQRYQLYEREMVEEDKRRMETAKSILRYDHPCSSMAGYTHEWMLILHLKTFHDKVLRVSRTGRRVQENVMEKLSRNELDMLRSEIEVLQAQLIQQLDTRWYPPQPICKRSICLADSSGVEIYQDRMNLLTSPESMMNPFFFTVDTHSSDYELQSIVSELDESNLGFDDLKAVLGAQRTFKSSHTHRPRTSLCTRYIDGGFILPNSMNR